MFCISFCCVLSFGVTTRFLMLPGLAQVVVVGSFDDKVAFGIGQFLF